MKQDTIKQLQAKFKQFDQIEKNEYRKEINKRIERAVQQNSLLSPAQQLIPNTCSVTLRGNTFPWIREGITWSQI
jgi:hypothetical protein